MSYQDIEDEITELTKLGQQLYYSLIASCNDSYKEAISKNGIDIEKLPKFTMKYQGWYTRAHSIVKDITPERLDDFEDLYRSKTNRKDIDHSNYKIYDALIGLRVSRMGETLVDNSSAIAKMEQQNAILLGIKPILKSKISRIKQILQADIFDNELDTSKELLKNGFVRASGAISGVILEGHLKNVCENHKVPIRKKRPSISDYILKLKELNLIDTPLWRKLQSLADIRNLCDHKGDREPTAEEAKELIEGVEKITRTLF